MKLTLSSGGGFTGLRKTHSIETESLDGETKKSLQTYFSGSGPQTPKNYGETWKLENGASASVDPDRMDNHLRSLYERMRSRLSYPSSK